MESIRLNNNQNQWYKISVMLVFLSVIMSNYTYSQENDYKAGMEIMPKDYSSERKGLYENMNAIKINGKWGIFDNNYVLTTPIIYEYVYWFTKGVCKVKFEGKIGYVDKSGNVIIQPKYDDIHGFTSSEDRKSRRSLIDEDISFYEISDKKGYIDINGKEITPPIFSQFSDFFVKGVAAVMKDNKWGLIDKSGNFIVPCIYKNRKNYLYKGFNAIAFIDEKGMCGFYNKDGKIIVPFQKREIPHDMELGSRSSADDIPPVFKINGKFELVKNIERFSDFEWFLDEFTINNKSFLSDLYNKKRIEAERKKEQSINENNRPIKSAQTLSSKTSANSELNQNFKNKGNNNTVTHCSYKVGSAIIQWKYSDNRKNCKYCGSLLSYRKYTSSELNNHKKNASLHIVYDNLNKHWTNSGSHDANLKEKELNDYYAWQKTTGLSEFEITFANQAKGISAMFSVLTLLGGESSSSLLKKIDLYKVGDGDFCNLYHKDLYYRNR